jgi:hypothetical protein
MLITAKATLSNNARFAWALTRQQAPSYVMDIEEELKEVLATLEAVRRNVRNPSTNSLPDAVLELADAIQLLAHAVREIALKIER